MAFSVLCVSLSAIFDVSHTINGENTGSIMQCTSQSFLEFIEVIRLIRKIYSSCL